MKKAFSIAVLATMLPNIAGAKDQFDPFNPARDRESVATASESLREKYCSDPDTMESYIYDDKAKRLQILECGGGLVMTILPGRECAMIAQFRDFYDPMIGMSEEGKNFAAAGKLKRWQSVHEKKFNEICARYNSSSIEQLKPQGPA